MQNLTSVMDEAPLPVFAVNEDGYYVYANQAAADFVGYDRTDITGKHLTDLVADDTRFVMASFAQLTHRGHISGCVRYKRRDGSLRDADVNVFRQTLADGTRVFVSLGHPLPGLGFMVPEPLQTGADYDLSDEQVRLLQLLAEGFSDAQVARLLGEAEDTIDRLVHELLEKMNASSRTEAAVLAIKKQVIL